MNKPLIYRDFIAAAILPAASGAYILRKPRQKPFLFFFPTLLVYTEPRNICHYDGTQQKEQ